MYDFVKGVDFIVFLKFLLCLVSPEFNVFVLYSLLFAGHIMSGVVLHCIVCWRNFLHQFWKKRILKVCYCVGTF